MEPVSPTSDFDFTQDFDAAFANIPLNIPPSDLFPGGDIPNLKFDDDLEDEISIKTNSNVHDPLASMAHEQLGPMMDRIPNDFMSASLSPNAFNRIRDQALLKPSGSTHTFNIPQKSSQQIQAPKFQNEFSNINFADTHGLPITPSHTAIDTEAAKRTGNVDSQGDRSKEFDLISQFDMPLPDSFGSDLLNNPGSAAPLLNAQEFQIMSQFFDKIGQDSEFLFNPNIEDGLMNEGNNIKLEDGVMHNGFSMSGLNQPPINEQNVKLSRMSNSHALNQKLNIFNENTNQQQRHDINLTNMGGNFGCDLNSELYPSAFGYPSNQFGRSDMSSVSKTVSSNFPLPQNLHKSTTTSSNQLNNTTSTAGQNAVNYKNTLIKDRILEMAENHNRRDPNNSEKVYQFGTDPTFSNGNFSLGGSTTRSNINHLPTNTDLPSLHKMSGIGSEHTKNNFQSNKINAKYSNDKFRQIPQSNGLPSFSETTHFNSSEELNMALNTLSKLSSQQDSINISRNAADAGQQFSRDLLNHNLGIQTGGQPSTTIGLNERNDFLNSWYNNQFKKEIPNSSFGLSSNGMKNQSINGVHKAGPSGKRKTRTPAADASMSSYSNAALFSNRIGSNSSNPEDIGKSSAEIIPVLPKSSLQEPFKVKNEQQHSNSSKFQESKPQKSIPSNESSLSPPSSSSTTSKSRHENLSEDQKRINHIYSEKRRRDLIKTQYKEMCSLVPRLNGSSTISGSECFAVSYSDATLTASIYSPLNPNKIDQLNSPATQSKNSTLPKHLIDNNEKDNKSQDLSKPKGRGRISVASLAVDAASAKSKSVVLNVVYEYLVHVIAANRALRNSIANVNDMNKNIPNSSFINIDHIFVAELSEGLESTL